MNLRPARLRSLCMQWAMALIFGAFMVPVCQLRDIESSWLISALGACCSFAFSFIAIG